MFGLALYFYVILSIAFSLFSTLTTKAFSVSLKLVVDGLDLASILTGVVYPLLVMGDIIRCLPREEQQNRRASHERGKTGYEGGGEGNGAT